MLLAPNYHRCLRWKFTTVQAIGRPRSLAVRICAVSRYGFPLLTPWAVCNKLRLSADRLESLSFTVTGTTGDLFQSIRGFSHLTTLSVTVLEDLEVAFGPAHRIAQCVRHDHLSPYDN
jgi:hypothetical protein